MLFRVFGVSWGAGGPDPQTILRRFVAAEPCLIAESGSLAPHYEVEITGQELVDMAAAREFDILISGSGFLAFDGKGRGFRQR